MIGKTIGGYRLDFEVGFGGMGIVYHATDPETGQPAAIKLLSQEYINDLGLRAAFEGEAQLVTRLTHEAIVPVYGFGQEGDQLYLVMQYMPNGSLADRLQHGALSPEDLAPILDRLCQAIDYAHKQGIIHRDLKPSNILFDDKDQAYLADFGIAQKSNSRRAFSLLNGTPAYLSPEQALGDEPVDGRCDIYALGIILFESLTGELPFVGQIPMAVLQKQIHDPAPSLRAVNRKLFPALDEVVQRALGKNPADRFATAGELADAYSQSLSGANRQTPVSEPAEPQPDLDSSAQADQPQDRSRGETAYRTNGDARNPETEAAVPGREETEANFRTLGRDHLEPSQVSTSGKWRPAHLILLGLAACLGIVVAAGLTAMIFLPREAAASPAGVTGIELSFDRTSLVLINQTQEPLDLSGLSFRRVAASDEYAAEFRASRWAEAVGSGQPALPPGMCYQLLLPGEAAFSLEPGRPLPEVPGCSRLQGWVSLLDPKSWFWVSEGDSDSFVVVWNDRTMQTCSMEAGSCQFTLEAP